MKFPHPVLITANLEGGEQKELITLDFYAHIPDPVWSPDGKVIVIVTRDKTARISNLVAVDSTTREQRQIVSSTEMRFTGPVWLPDGSGLVVLYSDRKAKTGQQQIGFISYPEGKFRAITRDTNSYLGMSISRDGKTLATVQKEQSFRLYLISSKAKSDEQATAITPRGVAYKFAWADEKNLILEDYNSQKFYRLSDRGEGKSALMEGSPYSASWLTPCQSGRYIVFMARDPKSSSGDTTLWRIETTNNEIIQLTNGTFDASPICSPDGNWVYYVRPNGEEPHLQKVSIDGGAAKTISTRQILPGIDVSRDGRLVAVWGDIFGVINAENGKVGRDLQADPRMGNFNGLTTYPHFTPDSEALAYTVQVDGVDNIWAQPIGGAPAYPITSFKSDEIFDFHWSPSGERLGIVRGRTESNVVLIREANP
jgi:eukaryotic-like serine/threonine-protein kinase